MSTVSIGLTSLAIFLFTIHLFFLLLSLFFFLIEKVPPDALAWFANPFETNIITQTTIK